MEERRTDSMQRLQSSSASAATTSPPCSSSFSSFIPRPPSPLDMSNFSPPFRPLTPGFSPDPVPAAKRPGIPPIPPSLTSTASPPVHTRSFSQPPVFDSLPHLALPPQPPPLCLDPMLVDDRQPSSRTPGPRDGLPPRRTHRRSHSDIPFGLPLPSPPAPRRAPSPKRVDSSGTEVVGTGGGCKSEVAAVDDLIIAYMDSLDTLNSSGTEEKHDGDIMESSRLSGTRTSGADSENEAESSVNETGADGSNGGERKEGNKRSAVRDLTPLSSRHRRSISMDSFMDKLHIGEESPKFTPSSGHQIGHLSRSGSMDDTMNNFSLEIGSGDFNNAEMKKIMADEKLAEMALADPKKVKRILANRLSAARSKERKMRYISELEHKVQILQTEATTLSAQLTMLQRDSAGLASQNNELKFRLQAMEQQAHLKDALNEALTAEVQRLKLATGEISEAQLSNSMNPQRHLNPQIFQLHQMQVQQQEKQQEIGQTPLRQLPLQEKSNNVSAKPESNKC